MHPGPQTSDPATAQRELARLMDGYLTTQLLYVAAKLGVATSSPTGRARAPRSRRQ